MGGLAMATSVGAVACTAETFAEGRQLLGDNGRLELEIFGDAFRVEVCRAGCRVWRGRVPAADCSLAAEIVRVWVERALVPSVALPVRAVPGGPADEVCNVRTNLCEPRSSWLFVPAAVDRAWAGRVPIA